MTAFYVPLLVCVMFICFCSCENDPIVTVQEGMLKGTINDLLDGGKYYSFKGIPYAQPPVGELRFRDPLPPKPWNEVRDASKHGLVCIQADIFPEEIIPNSEDCLFLNVYTRSLEPSAKLPVMVFIHGGGFTAGNGDSDFYGPEFLIQHNVIVVTMNYRLEIFGILRLDIPEVPGNAAMKDQVFALKWVKNNIAQFGGNPDDVTIFGESAGAGAVTYHLVSPMSKGLFHKAIAQSGTCISEWAIERDSVDRALRVSKELGKEFKDVKELLKFLQSVPASDLIGMTEKTKTEDEKWADFSNLFNFFFVEKKFEGVEPFLTEETIDILSAGKTSKVPLMIGYNSKEGLMLLMDDRVPSKNNNTQYLVPREILRKVSDKKANEIGERIKKYFVGDDKFSNDTADAFVNMITDTNFYYNMNRFAAYHAATSQPVFAYRFNYDTDLNLAKIFLHAKEKEGASHFDDMFYLFCGDDHKGVYQKEKKLQDIVFNLTKMWTDFAKTGNPTPDNSLGVTWEPYNTAKQFMRLEEPLSFGPNPDDNRLQFWNELFCEVNLPCIH